MKSFRKLFLATVREFYRDKTAIFFSFAFPVILILIFGLVFGNGGFRALRIGLVNESDAPVAQMIMGVFDQIAASEDMKVLEIERGDRDTELGRLRKGDIKAVLIIPADIEEKMASGEGAKLQIHYDPAETAASQIVLPILQQIVSEINLQLTQAPVLLSLESRSIAAHQVRNIDLIIPGIVAISVLSMGLFGCLPFIQLRQKGILRRLRVTPLRRSTMVSSQILFRLITAVMQTAIIILVGWALFDVQMLGSWAMLAAFVALGALTFVCMGYVIAAFVRTEEGAIPVIQLIFMPMMFLSGIFFPVEMMPGFMKPVLTAMPLTYLGDALRQIMVEATPLHAMATNAYVLAGWLVLCVALSIRFFRWE